MDEEHQLSKSQIYQAIKNAKQNLQKDEELPSQLYVMFNKVSELFLSFLEHKGQPGWVSQVKDEKGQSLFSEENAQSIESMLSKNAYTQVQRGGDGAFDKFSFRPGAQSSMIQPPGVGEILQDFSLDDSYDKIKTHMYDLDNTLTTIGREVGPVAQFEKQPDFKVGPYGMYMPFSIPVPRTIVVGFFIALLESLRLMIYYSDEDSPFFRKLLSMGLAMIDLSRGQWKNALLSFVGVFGKNPILLGVFGKVFLLVYNFISPNLQNRIHDDIYASGKSMILGFWLWLFSVVSPDSIRSRVMEFVEKVRVPIEEINKGIDAIEAQVKSRAREEGLIVEFPRLPLERVPSFDDIQNFQALLQQPEVYCNPMIKEQIMAVHDIFPLRVIFELMNIPMNPRIYAQQCRDVNAVPAAAISKILKPTVYRSNSRKNKKKNESSTSSMVGGKKESFYTRSSPAYSEEIEKGRYGIPLSADGIDPSTKQRGGKQRKTRRISRKLRK